MCLSRVFLCISNLKRSVGLDIPTIEVQFEHLCVKAEAYVGTWKHELLVIDVSGNQFPGELPTCITGLKKLQKLRMQENSFSGRFCVRWMKDHEVHFFLCSPMFSCSKTELPYQSSSRQCFFWTTSLFWCRLFPIRSS
jgi:hypothetical protein